MILAEGNVVNLAVLISFSALMVYSLRSGVKDKLPTIRTIPAFEAIKEAVGRCAELGVPIICHSGAMASLSNPSYADQTVCSLNILSYICELSAKSGTHVISYVGRSPQLFLVTEEMMRQGYLKAGYPDIKPDVRAIIVSGSHAWEMRVAMEIVRLKAGALVCIGPHATSFIDTIEGCVRAGALIIAGTTRTKALSYIMPAADYTLISDEIYAASALASQDPLLLFSLRSLDWCKLISLGGMGILFISVLFGQYDALASLLGV